MLRIFCIILLYMIFSLQKGAGQPKIEKEFSYVSDLAFNLKGGHQTGFAWLGCFQASLLFDTNALKLWKNGKLKFAYISTHGKSFSEFIGDIQIVSNIEAGRLSTIFELWYQHQVGRFEGTAGFIDINSIFSYSEPALSLINSSFGIQPTISGNITVPIYPITSLGVALNINLSDQIISKIGIFDGKPAMYQDDQLLPDPGWNRKEGVFVISELNRSHQIGSLEGLFKIGFWLHTQNLESHHEGEYSTNQGFYLIGEQELLKRKEKNLGIWGKFGGAPRDCNIIRFFNGIGFSIINDSKKNAFDLLSLGAGQVIFCQEFRKINSISSSETVLELTARKEIGKFYIQPDFQYIINPSGLTEIENPFCFIFRTALVL